MILNDEQIAELCPTLAEPTMIHPFSEWQVRTHGNTETNDIRKVISYGLSSMGYDLRLAGDEFKVFSPIKGAYIDPKNFDENTLIAAPARTGDGEYFLIPPHSYALGLTLETFNIPEDVLGLCVGKSTYARCGLVVNTTPLEPGWKGRLVLELANTADLPLRAYIGEGIAQCLFFRASTRPGVTYQDRSGKYQGQSGLTLARV